MKALQTIEDQSSHPFGDYEEEAIISLLIDHSEFFMAIGKYLKAQHFKRSEAQFVIAVILEYSAKYNSFPTRGMLLETIKKKLTVDDVGYEEVIRLAERESDPREIAAIKDCLLTWARSKAYGLLFDPDVIAHYNAGDYDHIEEIFNEARNIQDVSKGTYWMFEELEKMFVNEELEHFTTGLVQLDSYMHDGGPCRKEVVVWMAPTGVGKSIMLANNAVANVLRGRNVLYITMEMSDVASALRALGVLTRKPIGKRRFDFKDEMMSIVNHLKGADSTGTMAFHEFPPDEISVNEIHALIDHLKRSRGWSPDVICIDYLELMVSRRASDNREEYMKQKGISTQVRGLAAKENVLVFTATQTNRSGNDGDKVIDVSKISESYGKSMPLDYLISINQTKEEYDAAIDPNTKAPIHPAIARMYIAKNRWGPKFQTVPVRINYSNMYVEAVNG